MGNGTKTIITILALLIVGLITFIITDRFIRANSNNTKENIQASTNAGNVSATTTEEKNKKSNFATKYSKTELEKLALDYYEATTGYRPGKVASEVKEDGKLVIQLYDSFSDHNSTCDWYTIDMNTGKGTNITEDIIDLTDIPEKKKTEQKNETKTENNTTNTKNTTTNNNTKTNTTTTTTTKTVTQDSELKKALKSEKWLKENVYITEEDWGGSRSEQLLSFMIIKGSPKGQIVLVQAYMQEQNISKGVVVSYQNGKVAAKPLTEWIVYDGMIKADPNNAIVRIENNLTGGMQYRILDIKNGIPEILDTYGYYYGGEHEGEWYFKEDFWRAVPTISRDEYTAIARKYENTYNFYTIGTMLTTENIDKYVK